MGRTVVTIKKKQLGREILAMITNAGVTQAAAGQLIDAGQPRIAGLIKGEGQISVGDLLMLANGLGFTDPGYHQALRELRKDNHKRGYWTTGLNRAYAEDLRLLIDMEKIGDKIRAYEVEIIPGIAQCESYARALHADTPYRDGDLPVEDRVKARLARQDIYDRADPPDVHFVLSESCLARHWADVPVMLEQLDFLIELSNRPNVYLKVWPFNVPAGRRASVGNRFTMVRIPTAGNAGPLEMVAIENPVEIQYWDTEKALTVYDRVWDRLSNASLNYATSREFLKRYAMTLRTDPPTSQPPHEEHRA